ncbi:hypothetical protein [Rhizobium sp. CCGE531]|uniref:hypothetical protein n=1 Tax=Rhizobium sp. CCGE531 TaxID=2364271 RepID=UPI001FE1C637|nr:hypothetical protein [Rhizobium sp. CCGE531]
MPDILRVNRYLMQADPSLAADLAKIGVRLEVADTTDKTVTALLRSAQDASGWLVKRRDPVDASLAASVEALCRDAHKDHDWRAGRGPLRVSNRKLENIERWLELPMRTPPSIPLEDVDWEAVPWLSSWEISLPPDRPRYFHHDDLSGRTWLLSGGNI